MSRQHFRRTLRQRSGHGETCGQDGLHVWKIHRDVGDGNDLIDLGYVSDSFNWNIVGIYEEAGPI